VNLAHPQSLAVTR